MFSMKAAPLMAAVGIALLPAAQASAPGARVHYVGGTGALTTQKVDGLLELNGDDALVFACHATALRIPYQSINTLEYGEHVDRRYIEAILISPLMLLSKKRTHFLTIGFTDTEGHQQAMVFRVGSGQIRTLLVSLEAKTGRKVEYQDEEARRSGKG